jgi:porin
MKGVPLRTVQGILGHKTYMTTLRYAPMAPELRKDAVERLCGENTGRFLDSSTGPGEGVTLPLAAKDGTPGSFGEGAGTRTRDPRLKKPLLYQLSYALTRAARHFTKSARGGPFAFAALLLAPAILAAQEPPAEEPQTLTGSWGGLRDTWAEHGVTFALEATYTFQSVVDGGWENAVFEAVSDEDDEGHTLSGDLRVELDTEKAGLWAGGFVNLRVDARTGRSVLQRAGSVSSVNNDALFPNVVDRFDEDALAVSELSVTQVVAEGVELFAGLINPAEGDENEIAGAALSNATFFNGALLYSMVEDATVPNVSLGGGVVITLSETVSGSVSVFGTAETAGENPFKRGPGTTFSTEWTVAHVLGERGGANTFGALYGIEARRTDIAADPRRVLISVLLGQPVPDTDDPSWSLYWNGHQYVQGDGAGGWGVFGRLGLSDGDPNPVKWNAALGIGGVGLIPGRSADGWGVGAFYLGLSEEDLLKGLRVDDEAGGEAYYRIVVVPGFAVTLDAQVIDSALPNRDTSWVLGLRTSFVF